ncbi:MAG: bifunctional riboflavin kinase/FAD synthetase [Reichenbachiella sp.]
MIILEGIESIAEISNAIVTSGTFDGVHVGHQKILKKIVKTAKAKEGKSVVLTFWPHPRFILFPDDDTLKLLSTFEEKAQLLKEVGIDYLVKIQFTKEFSEWSSEEFIQEVLVNRIKAKKLVIGYDHKFGKNREGSFEYLKENSERFGFKVQEIPRQDIEEVGVSSTKIREALLEGHVHLASEYMGRPYAVSGTVINGKKIGRDLGFPTANIHVSEPYKIVPKDGVYAVLVEVEGQTYQGMLNVGLRPTVDGLSKVVEVNIFDFNADIYTKKLTINFVKRLRDEIKFESLDALIAQLVLDKQHSLQVLN